MSQPNLQANVFRHEIPKCAPWSSNFCFPLGIVALVIEAAVVIAMLATEGYRQVDNIGSWIGLTLPAICGLPLAVAGIFMTRTRTSLEVSDRRISITRDGNDTFGMTLLVLLVAHATN